MPKSKSRGGLIEPCRQSVEEIMRGVCLNQANPWFKLGVSGNRLREGDHA